MSVSQEERDLMNENAAFKARIALLVAEKKRPRDEHFAVGEVREHNGSLMIIGALHPQIELDALPIGTKVYIKLALQEQGE